MLGICAPAGDPARDIAEPVRSEHEVHSRRAAGQLLFPDRNLVVLDGRGHEHDELAGIMREIDLFLPMRVGGLRIVFAERGQQHRRERVALVVGDDDEPPWIR